MVDRRLVDEWLGKADEDFGFASINLDEDRPFFPQICFHFHRDWVETRIRPSPTSPS